MAKPIWQTPAGNLGVIPQGVYFAGPNDGPLVATNAVRYTGIAGVFPDGIQLLPNGTLNGVPVVNALSKDTEYQFTIRAYSADNRIADRTFSLTITGNYFPIWITPAGSIGSAIDSNYLDYQFLYSDSNPNVEVRLFSGQLPGGITLSSTGRLTGYVQPPVVSVVPAPPGYDRTAEDVYPYDFVNNTDNQNYEFSLEIYDGVNSSVRTFSIFVYNRDNFNASTTLITADNTFITADETTERAPFLINFEPSNLGFVRSDNYYAYDFVGEDYDGVPINFAKAIPHGQTAAPIPYFDSGSGWYYGLIPDQGSTEITYDFSIIVYRAAFVGDPITCTATAGATNVITCDSTLQLGIGQPITFRGTEFGDIRSNADTVYYVKTIVSPTEFTVSTLPGSTYAVDLSTAVGTMTANLITASRPYPFSLTIGSTVQQEVVWLTDAYLGAISNGATSLFKVEAVDSQDRTLLYKLVDGDYNLLPQGLTLLPSGEIAGRVSFDTFSMDLGKTTFDEDININRNIRTLGTTFDLVFDFTVNAYVPGDTVSVQKTFSITLVREYNEPYQNLYIKAMPPQNDRDLIASLLNDDEIFVPDYIFRPTDPNFGKAKNVTYYHAYGLAPDTLATYVSALYENHYWKNLTLGEIRTAQALDADGNVIYEVVYSKIVDDLVNDQGQSVSKIVTLPYVVNPGEINDVYPNSLINMRNQMIDVVGQISPALPRWMLSRQKDGTILGFTPAWVLAYTKPGRSDQIAYYLNTQFSGHINRIDFKVDRYELDALLSKNWDPTNTYISGHNPPPGPVGDVLVGPGTWTPTANQTTFDKYSEDGKTFLTTVKYATNLAYADVNNRRQSYINNLGGIDGHVALKPGDTIIFVKQENYDGPPGSSYATTDDAWQDYIHPFDTDGFSATDSTYDQAITVSGGDVLFCSATYSGSNTIVCDSTNKLEVGQEIVFTSGALGGLVLDTIYYVFDIVSPVEFKVTATSGGVTPVTLTTEYGTMIAEAADIRMGIFTVSIDPAANIVTLNMTTQTHANEYVSITNGSYYRGSNLFYPTVPEPGFTRIAWEQLPVIVTNETTFDHNSLMFIEPVDMYDPTDEYDKYLVFPYTNILRDGNDPNAVVYYTHPWLNNSSVEVEWINNDSDLVSWISTTP